MEYPDSDTQMTPLFLEFFKTEKASGIVLLVCTMVSLLLANSGAADSYIAFWQSPLFGQPLSYWINDGLMTIFFLLVGLEIEREIYAGELSQPRKAILPIMAALGGMAVPALIHFSFNAGTQTQAGIGIPMATDIAFALGVLSLLGNRVPIALKVFLTALAIIDDLGAIILIAFFYTGGISLLNSAVALSIFAALLVCNRRGIHTPLIYLAGGIPLWYFTHEAGFHATISGVFLAFLLPFGKGEKTSPSARVQHSLHYIVAFAVLPLFAAANTALPIRDGWQESLASPNSMGIIGGLVAGKFIGISLFSWLSVRSGLCALPEGVLWTQIFAVSLLAGIGFTMSMFITLLAFQDAALIDQSKIAILVASVIAGTVGFISLRISTQPHANRVSA
jgi:Na+:H+ antiporter, NhaA family